MDPFYSRENWGSMRQNHFPHVTQLKYTRPQSLQPIHHTAPQPSLTRLPTLHRAGPVYRLLLRQFSFALYSFNHQAKIPFLPWSFPDKSQVKLIPAPPWKARYNVMNCPFLWLLCPLLILYPWSILLKLSCVLGKAKKLWQVMSFPFSEPSCSHL